VRLTPTEFSLLRELALNPDKVMTYMQLLQRVWGPEYTEEKEYLHVFIGRLRNKLEANPANPSFLLNVPGVGYMLRNGHT
jgi:two-component system KDP operon response regulator KdpE